MAGSSSTGARDARPVPGPVMVIGGAEDKMKDRIILSRFVKDAGGGDARIVVIATASSLGDAATEFYRRLFTQLGAKRVDGLRPVTREDANEGAGVELVAEATGVFLTGGNQLRLSSVVGGTRLGTGLLEAHERGAVLAGTSAGASAMATHMMAFGASGATPKHRMAQMSAGLGIVRGMVIDQHFEQRTRLGRLLAAVAQSPSMIGLGLDEDTAAIIHSDQTLEVIGRGAVTIVDGSSAVTDAFHTKGYRPMMVSGAVLHSLPSGFGFDLERRVLLPVAEPTVRPGGRARKRVAQMARRMAAEGANSFSVEEPVREASE